MINFDYDIRPLCAAVILQAAREAKQDETARAWLAGEGLAWLSVIGIDLEPEQMRRWIAGGCKTPRRAALQLGA